MELAERAVEAGDEPFGSRLVSGDGEVLFEDHDHVVDGLVPHLAERVRVLHRRSRDGGDQGQDRS